MKYILKTIAVLLSIAATTSFSAFTFMKLWEWFISTTFDFNQISFIESIVMVILLQFITDKRNKSNSETCKTIIVKGTLYSLVNNFVFLSLGYAAHLLM